MSWKGAIGFSYNLCLHTQDYVSAFLIIKSLLETNCGVLEGVWHVTITYNIWFCVIIVIFLVAQETLFKTNKPNVQGWRISFGQQFWKRASKTSVSASLRPRGTGQKERHGIGNFEMRVPEIFDPRISFTPVVKWVEHSHPPSARNGIGTHAWTLCMQEKGKAACGMLIKWKSIF